MEKLLEKKWKLHLMKLMRELEKIEETVTEKAVKEKAMMDIVTEKAMMDIVMMNDKVQGNHQATPLQQHLHHLTRHMQTEDDAEVEIS